MEYSELPGKWSKVENFIEENDRLPSISGPHQEKELAQFFVYVKEQRNKKISDFPDDSNGAICFYLFRFFNKQIDELNMSNRPDDSTNQNLNDANSNNKASIDKDKESELDALLNNDEDSALSAFSPNMNFVEDENGKYVLSETQLEILERIKSIQEFMNSHHYIRDSDKQILEMDILIQKNLFEQKIDVNRDDNLCKFWDECILFDRIWKDPLKPKAKADYFFNCLIKRNHDDVDNSIPGFMLIGFDVKDDFIPNLTLEINKDLFDTVYSFTNYYQRDAMFFVSSKKIYLLRWGSHSDYPAMRDEDVFDDFNDFFNACSELRVDTFSGGSLELKAFYSSIN